MPLFMDVLMTGQISGGVIFAKLLGPFLSLGIIFSVNKVVSSLVGGTSGSGLGGMVAGITAGAVARGASIASRANLGTAGVAGVAGGAGANSRSRYI